MENGVIIVVDDQQETLDLINEVLDEPGRRVLTFNNPREALEQFDTYEVDIVITDVRMSIMTGLEMLDEAKAKSPQTEVIMMTAHADINLAVQAMKRGAADFFRKPLCLPELTSTIDRLSELQLMRRKIQHLSGDEISPVGSGDAMKKLYTMGRSVAETDSTVLILGETGVGKEVLATYIQRLSQRVRGPYVKINCAALPDNLLESELFGHEKGAFTGATDRRHGRFERAHGGTLFLDEIGEMPHSVQVKLLRVLQSHEIERIGGTQVIPVDFRLICATHRDLHQLVADGKFREDLLYRINIFPMFIPPLREHIEDIPALAYHFLKQARNKIGRGPLEIAPDALAKLGAYDWPGNIRELENVVERACVLAGGHILTEPLIQLGKPKTPRQSGAVAVMSMGGSAPGTPPEAAPAHDHGNGHGNNNGNGNGNGSGHVAHAPASNGLGASVSADVHAGALDADSHADPLSARVRLDVENPLNEAERVTLELALKHCNWDFRVAAEKLKLSRSTLYAKASRYGIKKD